MKISHRKDIIRSASTKKFIFLTQCFLITILSGYESCSPLHFAVQSPLLGHHPLVVVLNDDGGPGVLSAVVVHVVVNLDLQTPSPGLHHVLAMMRPPH